MVLAPYGKSEGYPSGIQYAIGGQGCYLCPPDPQQHRRGEAGFYYDTALGEAPRPAWLGPVAMVGAGALILGVAAMLLGGSK